MIQDNQLVLIDYRQGSFAYSVFGNTSPALIVGLQTANEKI